MSDWYFSRSDAELYDTCPRARFNRTIGFSERGVVRIGSSFELSFGRIIHRCTEAILQGHVTTEQAASWAASSILKIVLDGEVPHKVREEFHDQFSREAQALAAGQIWAWSLHVLPLIQASYNVVQVEEQAAYRRDGMVLPTVADVILESKDDGTLIYPDWKTAAWVNGQWMKQWNRSAQLFLTALAVEQALGREIEYCYIQALVKGRWQNGYQQSPLCWGYSKDGAGPPEGKENPNFQYKYTAKKGFVRVPQWQVCSVEQWVRGMPQELAISLVPRTPPITIDRELAETWWRQRVIKEQRIQSGKRILQDLRGSKASPTNEAYIMDATFPQDFRQCDPVIGYGCDYYDICHDPIVGADPIGSGLYRRRPTYAERLKEEGQDADSAPFPR